MAQPFGHHAVIIRDQYAYAHLSSSYEDLCDCDSTEDRLISQPGLANVALASLQAQVMRANLASVRYGRRKQAISFF
jgi:hypothetical protein